MCKKIDQQQKKRRKTKLKQQICWKQNGKNATSDIIAISGTMFHVYLSQRHIAKPKHRLLSSRCIALWMAYLQSNRGIWNFRLLLMAIVLWVLSLLCFCFVSHARFHCQPLLTLLFRWTGKGFEKLIPSASEWFASMRNGRYLSW